MIPFNRSPQVQPTYEGDEVVIPDPPGRPPRQSFPVLAMIAPLFVGVGLWFFTRSLLSLVFVAVSPLLMIGSFLDQRLAARRVCYPNVGRIDWAATTRTERIARPRLIRRCSVDSCGDHGHHGDR